MIKRLVVAASVTGALVVGATTGADAFTTQVTYVGQLPEATAIKHLSGASPSGTQTHSVVAWKSATALHVSVAISRFYPQVTDVAGYARFSTVEVDLLKWGHTYASLVVDPGASQAVCAGGKTRVPMTVTVLNGQKINVAVQLGGLVHCGLGAGATVSVTTLSALHVLPPGPTAGPGSWAQADFDAATLKF